MRPGAPGVVLAVAVMLGGCGVGSGSLPDPGFAGGGSCSGLPGGACQEQMHLAAGRHPGATQLDLVCTAPVCTRAGGAGTVTVTLDSGVKTTEAFTYAGNAAPVPPPTCTGLAGEACRRLGASIVDDTPPSKVIKSISIACRVMPCTNERGEADVKVQFADGSEFVTNSGWEGGLP